MLWICGLYPTDLITLLLRAQDLTNLNLLQPISRDITAPLTIKVQDEILLFIDAKIIVKLLWKAPILKEQFYLLGAENKTFGNPTSIFSFSFGSKTKILSRITLLTLSAQLAKSRTSFHFTKFFILQVKFKHRHIQCNKW